MYSILSSDCIPPRDMGLFLSHSQISIQARACATCEQNFTLTHRCRRDAASEQNVRWIWGVRRSHVCLHMIVIRRRCWWWCWRLDVFTRWCEHGIQGLSWFCVLDAHYLNNADFSRSKFHKWNASISAILLRHQTIQSRWMCSNAIGLGILGTVFRFLTVFNVLYIEHVFYRCF